MPFRQKVLQYTVPNEDTTAFFRPLFNLLFINHSTFKFRIILTIKIVFK